MRLLSLRLRGITTFTDPIKIDFTNDGLTAIVGPNGAGKTTLLEAAIASLYKTMPTRPGSLYESCHGRDAYIESTWEDGDDLVNVRLLIDAEQRKCEGYVTLDGAPVTDGKAGTFDAWIEEHFGSMSLLLASAFAAQNKRGSFLDATKGQRKELFGELLGLAYLQQLADAASQRRNRCESDLHALRGRLAELADAPGQLAEVQGQLEAADRSADEAAAKLATARTASDEASTAVERSRAARERLTQLERAERSAREAVTAAEARLRTAEAEPGRIRARAAEARRLHEQRDPARDAEAARQRHAQATAVLDQRAETLRVRIAAAPDAEIIRKRLSAVISEISEARTRRERIVTAEGKAREVRARFEAAEQAHRTAVVAREREIARLRGVAEMIGKAPCTVEPQLWTPSQEVAAKGGYHSIHLAGTCPLLTDARVAEQHLTELLTLDYPTLTVLDVARAQAQAAEHELNNAMQAAPANLTQLEETERTVRRDLAEAEAVAGLREQVETIDRDLETIRAEHETELASIETRRQAWETEGQGIQQQFRADTDAAVQAGLAAAGDLDRARETLTAATADLADARAALAGNPQAALDAAEAALELVELDHSTAHEHLVTLRTRVEQLGAQVARLRELEDQVAGVETELGDWTLLARGLGKEGVQALEVDAAAPAVAETANELLRSCYGPRFSLTLETLREKKSARGEYSEVFDVRVYDGARERPVEALSGGERVVVGEGLSLALAIFNARKNDVRIETLFRDETAGALDPHNAAAYVQLLRRAVALGGFHQCVFIAHQSEVHEQADRRVFVEGGRIVEELGRAA